ncbi:MAG: dehydratase [Tagaea sp. CACIAM 22H2]|nr:dehydratase [Tagaea sp. CACIAM 22H2]
MTIVAIETIRTEAHDNLVWVRIETSSGLAGLGETFFAPEAVETYIHTGVAPNLLGRDESAVAGINRDLVRQPTGYASSGVEMRAASAIDIALWDLLGRKTGQPLYALLGGKSRDAIPVYNTCAGPHYVKRKRGTDVDAWFGTDKKPHPLDDLRAFEEEPERLARELVAEGIKGMKIWPFDRAAFANRGVGIDARQIEEGLRPFKRIRDTVGGDIELMVELHALWDLASARRIIRAVEAVDPLWIEDPLRMDDIAALGVLARDTRIPILACETLAPASSFLPLIASGHAGIVSCDPGWCGGLSQARAIADMAAAAQLPFCVHDCTGPVGYVAGTHLSISAPTAMLQETVRAYLRGWYADTVTALPRIEAGVLTPLDGPGLGLDLAPAFLADKETKRRRTALQSGGTQ